MTIVDVTVPLSDKVPTYPGNVPFSLQLVKTLAAGASSNVSALHLGAHTGTHVDAPRHFFDDGRGVEALPLEVLVGPARVVELPTLAPITAERLSRLDLDGATRVLFKTGNSGLWSSAEFSPRFAHVTADAAEWLVERGIRLVGVDYLSVEGFKTPGAPAHHVLLGAGVVVVEGLDLSAAPAGDCELLCLPLPVAGGDGAPARVVLRYAA
jgi:arylformamidase